MTAQELFQQLLYIREMGADLSRLQVKVDDAGKFRELDEVEHYHLTQEVVLR
jgi:hypothetical protein